MATELQRQVERHRETHFAAFPSHATTPSLFYTSKEAGLIDISTVHEAAVHGLHALRQYDSRFDAYLDDLLHSSSISVQRQLQTAEENKALNAKVNNLLALLALYASEVDAHKVLDYLIRRYRIHELNTSSLLQCMLPHHDTKIFARVVQLAHIEHTSWAFLVGVKQSGAPPPRTLLAKHAAKDLSFLQHICDLSMSAVRVAGDAEQLTPLLQRGVDSVVTFFTSLIIDLIADRAIKEDHLRTLYTPLKKGISTGYGPVATLWRQACCMIVAQLSKALTLALPILSSLVSALSKGVQMLAIHGEIESKEIEALALTLVAVCSSFEIPFTPNILRNLLCIEGAPEPHLLNTLELFASRGVNVDNVLRNIAIGLIDGYFAPTHHLSKSHVAPTVCSEIVTRVLSLACVSDSSVVVDEITAKILHSVTVSSVLDKQSLELATSTLQNISQRFPKAFDSALQSALNPSFVSSKYALDDARKAELRKYIQNTFSATPHKLQYVSEVTNSDLGLFLALENPSLAIRVEALSKFASSISVDTCASNPSTDLIELGRAVLRCVIETSFDVCLAACNADIFSRLGALLPPDEVLSAVLQTFAHWSTQHTFSAKTSCEIIEALFRAVVDSELLHRIASSQDHHHLFLLITQTLQLNANSTERLSDHHRGLLKATMAFSEALGKAGMPLLSSFKASKNAISKESTVSAAREAVIGLIAEAIGSKISKKSLQEYITTLHKCLVLSHNKSSAVCSVLLSVLLNACKVVVAKSSSSVEAQVLLTLALCWTHNTHNVASSAHITQSLQLAAEVFSSSSSIFSQEFHAPVQNTLGVVVLRSLLSSGAPASATAIAMCLRTFFSASILPVLCNLSFQHDQVDAQFITAFDTTHECYFADCDMEIAFAVPSAHRVRVGALHTLSAYLSSVLSEKAFGSSHSRELHQVVMMLLAACCDASKDVRLGGLATAAELVAAPHAVDIAKTTLSKTNVSLLANALCSSSVGVQGDAVTCTNVLKEILKAPAVRDEFTSYFGAALQQYGWKVARLTTPLATAFLVRDLQVVWPVVQSLLLSASDIDSDCKYAFTLGSIIVKYLSITPLAQDLQSDITTALVACIANSGATRLAVHVKEELLKSFSGGWVKQLTDSNRELLFHALLQQQLTHSGNELIVKALQNIKVPLAVVIATLQERQKMLASLLQNSPSVDASGATPMQNGGHEVSLLVGAAQPVQQMSTCLEAVSEIIRSATDVPLELQTLAATLMDIFSLVGDVSMRTVLEVHYLRALLLDLAQVCLASLPKSALAAAPSKTPKKSKKSSSSAAGAYTVERIGQDIDVILGCIGSDMAMTAYGQVSALNLLKVLLTLAPQETDRAVATLSSVLSTVSLDTSSAKVSNFSVGIVQTVVEIRNQLGAKASPQEIVEPFMRGLGDVSAAKRHQLLHIMREIYDEGVLPTCVTTILGHTLASYRTSEQATTADIPTTIVLSKAAQRKAQRQMKTSHTEELFRMACSACMKASPHNQIGTLVALTSITTCLLELANGSTDHSISINMANAEAYSFDAAKYAAYVSSLSGISSGAKLHPALVLLNLQCVLHIVENKQFHRGLLTLFNQHDEGVNNDIQKLFLQLCEHLLELLGSAAQIQQRAYHDQSLAKASIQVVISETDSFLISPVEFARQVTINSLDIITSIQKLLDGPTFFVILQELLAHEESAVRQNALQLLSQRLQSTNEKSIAYDNSLFLDLLEQLRVTITQSVVSTKKGYTLKLDTSDVSLATRIGMIQSALLCLDMLVRSLGKQSSWNDALTRVMSDMINVMSAVTSAASNVFALKIWDLEGGDVEYVKLLGSVYLCCGTITSAIRVLALPFLATLMDSILVAVESQCAILRKNFSPTENRDTVAMVRSRVLLVRSAISAAAIIVSDVSAFAHPHLPRLLLALHGISGLHESLPDGSYLTGDVDRCLTVIVTVVPPRLSIPMIVEAAPRLLSADVVVSQRFISMLREMFVTIDRNVVTTFMEQLTLLSLLILDYRYNFGCGVGVLSAVDEEAADACVELCLKFTEVELKAYLLKLVTWQNLNSKITSWKNIARCTIFFLLVTQLSAKLKSIFVPLMGPIWPEIVAVLEKLITLVVPEKDKSDKKSKKRKAAVMEGADNSEVTAELKLAAQLTLDAVKTCCIHDNVDFIDQYRYESVLNHVAALLQQREIFDSDGDYMQYSEEHVIPALAKLVKAVGQDLLWKPLNHKVLMMTRDNRKSLKLIGLKTLHKLFAEAGEEYLVLLPECLPFFSELLEETSTDVTALTSEVIRFIENLSGESLESYLV